MEDDKSDQVFEAWRQSSERFDYVVLAGTGALCAYVAEKLPVERLSWSPATLELVALLLLILSAVAGFKRLEARNALFLFNHKSLRHHELAVGYRSAAASGPYVHVQRSSEVITAIEATQRAQIETELSDRQHSKVVQQMTISSRWYKVRNFLLLVGCLVLVVARVSRPYFQ